MRLNRTLVAVAILVAGAAGVGAWALNRPADPGTEATEAALRHVAAVGGPAGWALTDPAPLLPGPEAARVERRQGLTVAVDRLGDAETGFTVTWATTVTPAQVPAACDALTAWAVRVVRATDTANIDKSCRSAAVRPAADAIVASAGTEPDASGRYLFHAVVNDDVAGGAVLAATLSYDAPGQSLSFS